MCLTLTYVEARLWKQKAHELIGRARKATAKIPPDPLLKNAPQLSELVSVVEGIKKRHGLLIEDALIAAINFVPGWTAAKRVIPRRSGGVFKTDCLALNTKNSTAYVFECKRQYASFDDDKRKAIDGRLDEIAKLFPAYAARQGWSISTTGIFILSFYGGGSGSKYPIHDRRSVGTLFPPCAMRFVDDFIHYSEKIVGRWCSERIDPSPASIAPSSNNNNNNNNNNEHQSPAPDDNLFELLDRNSFTETDRFQVNADRIRVLRSTTQNEE